VRPKEIVRAVRLAQCGAPTPSAGPGLGRFGPVAAAAAATLGVTGFAVPEATQSPGPARDEAVIVPAANASASVETEAVIKTSGETKPRTGRPPPRDREQSGGRGGRSPAGVVERTKHGGPWRVSSQPGRGTTCCWC
jgi:hypothetical protein